jgi:hypothetical protein
VAILAFLTLAVAFAGRIAGGTASSTPGSPAALPATPSGPTRQPDAAAQPEAARPTDAAAPPASVACGSVASWWCRRVVQAAAGLLPGEEAATSARVYVTLVCGDDLDCPRSFLAAGSPAGSVVLTLADGASAWVNVVAIGGPRHIGEPPPRFLARLVRWFPPDA